MSQKTHCISVRKWVKRKNFRKITPVYFENYRNSVDEILIAFTFNPVVLYDCSAQFTVEETFKDKRS
jgi:hypothetical protein